MPAAGRDVKIQLQPTWVADADGHPAVQADFFAQQRPRTKANEGESGEQPKPAMALETRSGRGNTKGQIERVSVRRIRAQIGSRCREAKQKRRKQTLASTISLMDPNLPLVPMFSLHGFPRKVPIRNQVLMALGMST